MELRCNNCGWANPEGSTKCQKCNQVLDSTTVLPNVYEEFEEPLPVINNEELSKATQQQENKAEATNAPSHSGCPQCGYPADSDAKVCPMCGSAIEHAKAEEAKAEEKTPADDKEQLVNATKATVVATAILDKIEEKAAEKLAQSKQPQPKAPSPDTFKKTVIDANAVINAGNSPKKPQAAPAEAFKKTVMDANAIINAAKPQTANNEPKQTVCATAPSEAFKKTVMDANAIINAAKPQGANNQFKQTVRETAPAERGVISSLKKTVRDTFLADTVKEHASTFEEAGMQGCTLTPVDGFGNAADILKFAEKSVVLNRDNVDKGNVTIDEKAQLSLTFEDGAWYIENLSSLRNTYIVPTHKAKIESGDIIIIGNKRYIFG